MQKGLTELVFILDKSGSMCGLENDTIGGFNSTIAKQKAVQGEAVVTTVLFDNEYILLHDRINLQAIKPISEREYSVGGSTALLDAIGKTVHKIIKAQKNTDDDYRAEKVVLVIITDGEENSSFKYTLSEIKEMIGCQKKKYGWEFIFLGANIDAISVAESFGISAKMAADYHADCEGTECAYSAVHSALEMCRTQAFITPKWKSMVTKDYTKRKKS